MTDRKQKAEEAARAMGWWLDSYGTWREKIGCHARCAPDLSDWRFVGAMIERLHVDGSAELRHAIVEQWNDDVVRHPATWGARIADAVIARAKREAKR